MKLFPILIFAITAFFFAIFFVLPITETLKTAFFNDGHFTWENLRAVFTNPLYIEGLWNSFVLAFWSTLASIVLALPLALLSSRFKFFAKDTLSALLLVPMILPPFVGALGIKQLLGQTGVLNIALIKLGLMDATHPFDWLNKGQMLGVILMNALHLYPVIYLNVTAALGNLDPAMEEAAENLGCTPFRRFWRVTLPLIVPGLFAGGTIVFIWAFTELGVPLMFDVQNVTAVQIFNGIKDIGGNPIPYALVTVLLGTTVLLYGTSKWLFSGGNYAGAGRAARARSDKPLGFFAGLLVAGLFLAVILLAMLPHIGVVLTSVAKDWYQTLLPNGYTTDHFRAALGNDLTLGSIANSLKYASLATLVDIVLGTAIAWVCVRTKLPGRGLLDTMAMLPLAVPGLVMAFGYLALSKEGQPLHGLMLGASHDGPLLILVAAYSVRRLPYVVRSAAAGFQQTSVTLEEAAENLGCTPWRTLKRVTLPLISANLIAGGLLAFSFAMLEVSDSLVLAQQTKHFPITKAIYNLASMLGDGDAIAAALGVWAMVFLGITILGSGLILGRKSGAMFKA